MSDQRAERIEGDSPLNGGVWEVHRVPIPSYYRQIASGDVMPMFEPTDPPRWLLLFNDGSVRWSDRGEDL